MFVNRLRLLGVKPLRCDLPADGAEFPEPARHRLLLQGGNGSGKTVILETIATLWKFLGDWIDIGDSDSSPRAHLKHYLAGSDLAAMEIHGIAPHARPIWIGIGRYDAWNNLKQSYPKHAFVGLERAGNSWDLRLPGASQLESFRQRSLVGSEPQTNMVYFPPEGRTLNAPRQYRAELLNTIPFNWLASFNPKINLDSVLLTIKAQAPERFDECLRLVNLALAHREKRIIGFAPAGRLVVEGVTEAGKTYRHPIELLSSGEKQMLLMIGFAVAFLRPGGILLIDEPDLHIHISMIAQLMETLELIVHERRGQLIATSHSAPVWDWFSGDEERIELGPWRGIPHDVPA
jgi:ABC-type dipeptide/oligopeptide/nickel transport system ATPase component